MNFEPFTFILERLTDLLIDEVKLLSTDTKEQLGSLQKQLEFAQSFVRSVEEGKQQATTDHVLQTKVKHLMQMIPKIEDFLDTFYVQDEVDQSRKQSSTVKFMACFSCTSNPVIRKHDVIKTAGQLTEELKATHQMAQPYQFPSNFSQVTRKQRPPTYPRINNSEFIIGLEEDVKTLVAKLVGKDGDNTTILAIVGMGGVGKTTLARKLCNHQEITKRFTRRAWVFVSQEWDTPQLLHAICAQVHIPLAKGERSIAGVKLQEFLQRNSYFIVLDDVWKKEALQELLPILHSVGGVESGRVLITTRNENIVRFHSLGRLYIHKARCLTQDESWHLFSLIVRNAWQGIVNFDNEEELTHLGKEMLRKCNGLPLAIITLAGRLSTKTTIQEWESTKDNVISRLMKHDSGFHDYGAMKEMLELSYFDLPYDLKPCFLYLGIFKEDSHIDADELIQLWIGEGFLRKNECNECMPLEDIGNDFLDELVLRNMVQIVSRDFEGRVEKIQIHDVMRDLCVEKAKDLSFFNILSPLTLHSTSREPMSYRAVMHSRKPYKLRNSHLRSIVFYSYGEPIKLGLAFKETKFLRVLHLTTRVDLRNLEGEIGSLALLRYLRIEHCIGVNKGLLESIRNLRNVLIFIYRWNKGEKLPNNMVGSMKHLRHLCLSDSTPMLGVHKMSDSLRALELRGINCRAQLDAIYEFVSHPSNHLHKLILSGLGFNLQKMNLRSWRHLKTLNLTGRIRYQLNNLFFPPNLLKLCLRGTHIEKGEDLDRALTQLRQLRSLYLYGNACVGDKLIMTGLLQLQELTICELPTLKEWRIEEGSLSQLKNLRISCCNGLERMPEEISRIHTLQSFAATLMSESFFKRHQQPSEKGDSSEGHAEGEHFHLIRHIPRINVSNSLFDHLDV